MASIKAERIKETMTTPNVPAGWQLVPIEPTEEMIEMLDQDSPYDSRRSLDKTCLELIRFDEDGEPVVVEQFQTWEELGLKQFRLAWDHNYKSMLSAAPQPDCEPCQYGRKCKNLATDPPEDCKCWQEIINPKPKPKPKYKSANPVNEFAQPSEALTYALKRAQGNAQPDCAEQAKVTMPTTDYIGNWTEDFKHENGDYLCKCHQCKNIFRGYKRRVTCKVCAEQASFQDRINPWMQATFGPEISADALERNHRFFEEATELVQACGMTASEAHQLVDYTFGRPVGEKYQEVGGVMVTLAALCLAQGLNMHAEGEKELARVWTMVEKIRAKQAAKPKHSPLPEKVEQAEGEPVAKLSDAEMADCMEEAAIEIASWGAYASEYFQKKHGLAEASQKFQDKANELRAIERKVRGE